MLTKDKYHDNCKNALLDFVNSVEIIVDKETIADDEQDFFKLAGLWKNRNVTTDLIRQKAWREEF